MWLPKPGENSDFLPCPAGTYTGLCYRVIDLGTQQGEYMGKPTHRRKVLIGWEVSTKERTEDGRPFTVQSRYTWSMDEKASLRKMLESWRGRRFEDRDFGPDGFNIRNVIGKACTLTIVHAPKGDKVYANVAAVGQKMDGVVTPQMTNEAQYLWIDPSVWDQGLFEKLSDGLRQQIAASPEYQEMMGGGKAQAEQYNRNADGDIDDDLPF